MKYNGFASQVSNIENLQFAGEYCVNIVTPGDSVQDGRQTSKQILVVKVLWLRQVPSSMTTQKGGK